MYVLPKSPYYVDMNEIEHVPHLEGEVRIPDNWLLAMGYSVGLAYKQSTIDA